MSQMPNSSPSEVAVCIDNSSTSLAAVDWVLENIPGKICHLVHVQPRCVTGLMVGSSAAAGLSYEALEAMEEENKEESQAWIKETFIPRATAKGATVKATLLHTDGMDGSGEIGDAICSWAAKHKPCAVVMNRSQKSAVSRFFLGSVTRYCAGHAPCPIVIVPSPESKQAKPASADTSHPAAAAAAPAT